MENWRGFLPRRSLVSYTEIPNEFFDEVLGRITTLSELKIVLAVFRQTYGWTNSDGTYKLQDRISYSQFQELTGLSLQSVRDGIRAAEEHGYIEKVSDNNALNHGAEYRIRTLQEGQAPPKHALLVPKELKGIRKAQAVKEAKQLLERGDLTVDQKKAMFEDLMKHHLQAQKVEEEAPTRKRETKAPSNTKAAQRRKSPEFTPQDVVEKFTLEYRKKFGSAYGKPRTLEFMKAQQMLEWYAWEDLRKMTEWFFENYDKDPAFPKDPPNFHIFHGWRDHVYRMVTVGTISRQPNQVAVAQSTHKIDDNENLNTWDW